MAQGKRVKKRTGNNTAATAAIVCAVILGTAFIVLMGMGAYVANSDEIFPNVKVAGIDVGGMTYTEAHSTLLNSDIGVPSGVRATAVLTDLVSVSVTSDEAGLTASVGDAADMAFAYGREGGFFAQLAAYLKCLTSSHDVYAERQFNESGVRATIAEAAGRVEHEEQDYEVQVTATEIFLTKGSAGYQVDQEGVFAFIRDTLLSGKSAQTEEFSEATVSQGAGADPDFDALYEEVFREPVDAGYDPETQAAIPSSDGVSFDKEELKNLYEQASPGQTVRVELIITPPEKTGNPEDELFGDKLAEKDTSLSGSSGNRITNVTLAAAAVDGVVLNPGEEFDFNKIVGQRTTARGYKPAGAYVGGKSVNEVGGGICQVSSTIYFCALKSDLKITKRSNHHFTVAYLPPSLDATVSWGGPDFRFVNSRDYPIKIRAWVESKKLYVEIWGTKVDDTYVELESRTIETIPLKVEETVDETLAPGERVVDVSGHDGLKSEAYKLTYDGEGNLLKRELLSKDTYHAQNRVVRVGPDPSTPAGPSDNPEDNPGDNPGDNPTQNPSDNPEQNPGDNPTDNPTDNPSDNPTDNPTDNPADNPTDNPTENPGDNPAGGDDDPGEGDIGGGDPDEGSGDGTQG